MTTHRQSTFAATLPLSLLRALVHALALVPAALLVAFAAALSAQAPESAATAAGRDWFVRAGEAGGDGSRQAPFDDPWRALARCERNDRLHVAAGEYHGRLGRGEWEIPCEGVQLLGGYDATFGERDPWRHATRLCWDRASKNWPLGPRLSSRQRGVVVDGLVIDMQDQNDYVDAERTARTGALGDSALRFSQPATVRNCMVLNPGSHGIECVPGSTIENNVVVNAIVWGIVVTGAVHGLERDPAVVRGNTVLFSWDTEKPGAGGYGGSAIALRGPAIVADNVLAHSDNAAVYAAIAPEHLTLTGNAFWKSRYANLTAHLGAQRAVVTDADMELLEDLGLGAHDGNTTADPQLAFDATAFASGFAPAFGVEPALALLRGAAAPAAPGARRRALPSPAFAPAAAAPARTYGAVTLASWCRQPDAVDGKAIEMIVAIGGVANVQTMPASYPREQIAGVVLYDPDGSGERVTGFYRTGSAAERVCNEATGWYHGTGRPDRLHRVRGVAHAVRGVPKAALFVEAIERHEPPAAAAPRPVGRDWFVRAGTSGGDGTREQPFRDPFQALERCEAGDTIHVATGDYHGKLKAGRWTVPMPHVALLGGYDALFATRDPWRQPTRLLRAPDHRGQALGYTLEGTADHTGAVVDGFVFDKRGDNVYGEGGELDVARSDKTEHLWLSRPGCAVRNCVFANGALGAVRLASGHTVENNVFVNHATQTVHVERGHTTEPFRFLGNTAVFAWTPRFGQGHGTNGSLLRIGSGVRAVVADNVLAWADNDAIRLETDPADVELRGNVFAHNLWSNVQHMPTSTSVDDASLPLLADLGLRACEGNRAGDPELPVDATWLALHRSVRAGTGAAAPPPPPPAKPRPTRNPFDEPAGADPEPVAPAPSAATTSDPFADPRSAPADASGGAMFAPAWDWRHAVALATDGTRAAGARRLPLEVAFSGTARTVTAYEYAATTWAVALRTDAWAALDGTRVQLDAAIRREDRGSQLADVTEADYACWLVSAPDGEGLPLRCYLRRGTQVERAFTQAKGFATGKPTELHRVRGVARERRQLVVEAVERVR